MNLDLNHVQAFVAAADALHFGRAAQHLHLTQQGLSHRITRLEQVLGEPLFVRDGRTVELTAAGRRFLPHARELLAAASAAVADARNARQPLRVDVWGQLHAPLRWIGRLPALGERIALDVSMRRNTWTAIDAVQRGEIDAAFGWLLDRPLPPALRHEQIGIEPVGVIVAAEHPLAGHASIAADDLRGLTAWYPAEGTAPEILDYYRQLTTRLQLQRDEGGGNLGLSHLLAGLADRPDRLLLLPMGIDRHCVSITSPTPYVPWWMIWRRNDRNDGLTALRCALKEVAATDGPPVWDPATCWLPRA